MEPQALQEPHPCAAGTRTQPGTATALGTSWRDDPPTWGSLLSSNFHSSSAPLQKGNNICFICSSLRKPWGLDPRHPEAQNILPLQILWFKRGARDREQSKIPSSSLKNRKSLASLCRTKGFLGRNSLFCGCLPLHTAANPGKAELHL